MKGVYHSVRMKPLTSGGFVPAAPVNGKFIPVGIDDAKGFTCYVRQIGAAENVKEERIGGCGANKLYRFNVPHRVVFFNNKETRSHDEITSILLKAIMKTEFVKIQRVHINHEEILRAEAPTGRYGFAEATFYMAIDFFILLDTQTDNCDTEIQCEKVANPYCNTTG